MVPMASPIVGAMFLDLITILVVPTIYCLEKEIEFEGRGEGVGQTETI